MRKWPSETEWIKLTYNPVACWPPFRARIFSKHEWNAIIGRSLVVERKNYLGDCYWVCRTNFENTRLDLLLLNYLPNCMRIWTGFYFRAHLSTDEVIVEGTNYVYNVTHWWWVSFFWLKNVETFCENSKTFKDLKQLQSFLRIKNENFRIIWRTKPIKNVFLIRAFRKYETLRS